jgi:hypothetical protein
MTKYGKEEKEEKREENEKKRKGEETRRKQEEEKEKREGTGGRRWAYCVLVVSENVVRTNA